MWAYFSSNQIFIFLSWTKGKMLSLYERPTLGKGLEQYVTSNADAQLSWKGAYDVAALFVIIKIKDDVLVWNDALKGWNTITSIPKVDKIRIGFMFNNNDNNTVDAREHKVFLPKK